MKVGFNCENQKGFALHRDHVHFLGSLHMSTMYTDCISMCAAGKPTGENCDVCFEFIIDSIGRDYVSAVGLDKYVGYLLDQKYTIEEKMRAVAEGCAVKMEKAMKGQVNKTKLKNALKYPNGGMYKCPWEFTAYPNLMSVILEQFGEIAGPFLGAVAGK